MDYKCNSLNVNKILHLKANNFLKRFEEIISCQYYKIIKKKKIGRSHHALRIYYESFSNTSRVL